MKIKGFDGLTIDSDNMSDVESEIIDEQNELLLLCQKYDVPYFSFIFKTKPITFQHFSLDYIPDRIEKILSKWIGVMNYNVIRLSGGKYEILHSSFKNNINIQNTQENREHIEGDEWNDGN